jgi:DNA-binding SARP family transcriptional activator/tetratricopeptide (TPR) repeat protein
MEEPEPRSGTRIGLLGPVEVSVAGEPRDPGTPMQRCLLAALAVDAGRVVTADTLVDRLWGDAPPTGARRTLHTYVWALRRALSDGDAPISRTAGGYQLLLRPSQVDLFRSRDLLERGRTADGQDRTALLRAALDAWRGEPLAGVPGAWAARLRVALALEHVEMVSLWADAASAIGAGGRLVGPLSRFAEQYPLADPIAAALIRALRDAGRHGDALAHFDRHRRYLAEELGVDPGPQLRELHRSLLGAGTPPGPAAGRSELPSGAAVFVGRRDELRMLDELIAPVERWAPAMAVIHGSGGAGKTALALRWARAAGGHFPDGHLYLDLHGFSPRPRTPTADALRGLLRSLDVPAERMPGTEQTLTALYRSATASKRLLVVLDNAADAAQVEQLTPAGAGCAVLVTSRVALAELVALRDAVPIVVGPLPDAAAVALLHRCLPEVGDGGTDDLRRLAQLCGHLPLALRVAVANVRDGRHGELERLRAYVQRLEHSGRLDVLTVGADARLSLRGTFDLSYDALPAPAQRLFRLLGWAPVAELGAAAAGALAQASPGATADSLDRLVRAHLVEQWRPGRFRLHDLLKEYARDRCTDADRDTAVRALMTHFVAAAGAATSAIVPRYKTGSLGFDVETAGVAVPDRPVAFAWFDTERENIRALIRHADDAAWHAPVYRLAASSAAFFEVACLLDDFRDNQQRAVAAATALGDLAAVGWANYLLNFAHWLAGSVEPAIECAERALRAFRELGDRRGVAMTMRSVSVCQSLAGRFRVSTDLAREALSLVQDDAGAEDLACEIHSQLCTLYIALGRHAEALHHGRVGLHLARRHRLDRMTFVLLVELGRAHRHMGHPIAAGALLRRAYAQLVDWRTSRGRAEILTELGALARTAGRTDEAIDILRSAVGLADDLGIPAERFAARNELGRTLTAAGSTDEAVELHRGVLATACGAGHALHAAAAHEGLAAAVERGDPPATRRHLADALRIYAELEMPDADRVRRRLLDLRHPNGRSPEPSDH